MNMEEGALRRGGRDPMAPGTWTCLPWGHGGAVLVQEACTSNSSWLLLLLSTEQAE